MNTALSNSPCLDAPPSISALYHFTSCSNILSIISSGGLHSLRLIHELDLPRPNYLSTASSRRRDINLGLDRYISLGLTQDNPMAFHAIQQGRADDLIYLEICPSVLDCDGAEIADNFALAHDTNRLPDQDALAQFDFSYLLNLFRGHRHNYAAYDRLRRFEFLVPDFIDISLIRLPN